MPAAKREPRPARVRPRHAATLVLHRMERGRPHVLMGKRHAGHVFMPEKFVFPGGRMDPADARIEPVGGLRPEVLARVASKGTSPARARGLAMAAIRETWEETGLLVGLPVARPPRTRSRVWADFLRHGLLPDLSVLDFVARAITPPGSPRRFDARFFMCDAQHIHGEAHDQFEGSGELIDLTWVPVDQAKELDLPAVTEMVIGLLGERLGEGGGRPRVPFVRWQGNRNQVEYL
jgi:8-oxo-dGTP pyrophosphatase MutT (NUDIX family)